MHLFFLPIRRAKSMNYRGLSDKNVKDVKIVTSRDDNLDILDILELKQISR